MKVLKNLSEAQALVGQELGLSKWQRITQFQIWGFGLFTGDRQWIDMRPLKAKLGSPFKTTIETKTSVRRQPFTGLWPRVCQP